MPKNPLLVYIRDNLAKPDLTQTPGPVITISREHGCPGSGVSEGVVKKINEKYDFKPEKEWKAIDREIINQAALELKLPENLIEKISKEERKGIFTDMLQSTPYMTDDIKVKRTIAKIVYGLAIQGNVVIIGRGGVVITRNMETSLHIFLYAPENWRMQRIMQMNKCDKEKAIEIIKNIERERVYLRNLFAGEEITYNIYNACFNCEDFTTEQLEDEILNLAVAKKLLPPR